MQRADRREEHLQPDVSPEVDGTSGDAMDDGYAGMEEESIRGREHFLLLREGSLPRNVTGDSAAGDYARLT